MCRQAEIQKYFIGDARRRGYSTHKLIMDNKGHKYKNIIASLLSGKRIGKDIPRAITLNANKIDYVHWDPKSL